LFVGCRWRVSRFERIESQRREPEHAERVRGLRIFLEPAREPFVSRAAPIRHGRHKGGPNREDAVTAILDAEKEMLK
jgi:hypothetical protein